MKILKNLLVFLTCLVGFNSLSQVSSYTFSTTTGTYADITGATVLATATGSLLTNQIDDYTYTVTPSPSFSFYFNGVAYSTFYVSSNGFITFGSAPTTTNYTPISSAGTYAGAISAFGKDINAAWKTSGITNGSLSWVVTGTAPNRTLTFQWKNFREAANSSTTNVSGINFQIQLVESSNVVKIMYGSFGNLAGSTTTAGTCQVGLRGTSASDYNNRTSTTSWATTSAGGASSSSMSYTPWTLVPGAGRIYTWTPPATVISSVTSLTAFSACANTASTSQSFTVNGYSLTANITITAPTGFQVSTDNSTFSSSVTLTQSGGLVNSTTVYARMAALASSPTSGNITVASTGATTKNISVSGTVNNTSPAITTNPSNSSIAVGANTTFSVVASGSPTSYTWQVSTDGGTNWTTISNGGVYSGSTTATLTITGATISMNGYKYKASATNCVSTSSYSTVATLTVTYCTPTYSSGGANDYITSISLVGNNGTLSQSTASNTSPYYINYTGTQNIVPQLTKGATYTLSITFGSDANQYNGVWIDLNQDGTLATSEFFTSNSNAGSSGTVNVSLVIPSGATTGQCLMRIRGGEDSQVTSSQACGASSSAYGQAQDYYVNIVVPVPPTITSLGSSSGCAGTSITINGTNLSGVTAANVTIGGTAVSSITTNTSTQIVAVIGSGTTGTVSVTTAGGTATSSSTFTVTSAPTISYTGSPFTYSSGTAISTLTPSTTNSPTSFSISSTLPTGLSFNTSTGQITGTPSVTSTSTAYTITGTNSTGCTGTTNITIAVGPSNATCATATTLSCGSSSGTTVATTGVSSGIPLSATYLSGGLSDYGVWYKLVGDGLTYTITFTPSAGYDPEVDVMSGSCGSYTAVTAVDAGASGTAETVTFSTTVGVNYYIYIAHYSSGNTTTGTFTINTSSAPATPSAITGTSTVCSGSTGNVYSVTNVSGMTYNWTVPSGWSGSSTSNSITLTAGSSSGTLSVTASNSCGTSVASTISLVSITSPSSVNAGSDVTMCLGSSTNLSGSAGGATATLNSMNSATDFSTTINNGGWSYVSSGNAGGSSPELVYTGSLVSGNVNKYLQWPNTLNGSGATSISMTFKSMVDWYTGTFTLKVQTSTDGTTWNDRWSISPTADVSAGTVTVDLTADANTTFYYRFLFSGNKYNINYWYVDDVVITATYPVTYSWSPSTGLSSTSIYNPVANPTSTQTYTLTATSNGCSSTDQVQITINQPDVSSINTSIGGTLSSGDFVWNGSSSGVWSNATNWYTYNGTTFDVATTDPTTLCSTYIVPSLTTQCISSSNSPTLSSTDVVTNLTVVSGATLTLVNNLSVTGNVKIDGTLSGIGTLKLTGTGTQTISGSGTVIIPNLEINKSSGSVTVSSPIRVTNTLTMVSGNLNNGSNLIEIGTNATGVAQINWTSGTITGPLKRWFSATTNSSQMSGVFPVGNSSYNRWAQINFTSAPSSGGYITVQYKSGLASTGYNGFPLTASDGQVIQNCESDGYWEITPDSYTGSLSQASYTIALRGNNLPNITDMSVTRIIKSSGPSHTSWSACGTHGTISGVLSDFTINSTSNIGFSYFNIGFNDDAALPIELLSFSGECQDGGTVINWETASEHNSAYFTIEKSRDGINWTTIETTGAAGNSSQLISYSYFDKGALGINYYRLNQADFNGVINHYGPISVNCESIGYFSTFPNPSGTSFNILINDERFVGNSTVEIVDEMGKTVFEKVVQVKAGINLIPIDNVDLKPGVYFITMVNDQFKTDIIKQSVK